MAGVDDCTQKLLQTLPSFMRMLGGAMRRQMSQDDQLSFGHIHMLETLYHRPRNLRDLAQHHHVTPSTMSRSVELLVKRGLVERRNNPDDRREIELRLSDAGLETFLSMTGYSQEFVYRLITELDDDERVQLSQGLDVLQKMMAQAMQCGMPQGKR